MGAQHVDPDQLVSVIIPSYNHARFVEACLSSIVADGYPAIEVILIDDGSTDETFERVSAWRASHPDAFVRFHAERQSNHGLNPTLNKLLRLANGRYVCPLASDDMLAPGGIACRVAALQRNPAWLAVFGDCDVIDNDGRQTHASAMVDLHGADKIALANPRRIETELIWRWSVPGPVLLADRDIFFGPAGYGLYPEGRIVEDRDFYLSALAKKQLGFVDYKVASYRLHGANLSRLLGPEVERQNRDAERQLVGKFEGVHRAGLLFKLATYRIIVTARKWRNPFGILAWRSARKIDHLLTCFVLGLNSKLARRP